MNKIEALNDKALEAAVLAHDKEEAAMRGEPDPWAGERPEDEFADRKAAMALAIRAYLTASDAEREPVSAAETTADTLQRFPKIMGALAESEREPVAWPRIMYVCEYCQENNPEMCGHDRTDLHVTPDGRWLCDACLEDDGAPIADCSSPPLLYTDPLPLTDLEAENARLRESREFWKRVSDGWSQLAEVYKARLAEALKALEPFAEQADNPQWWNDSSIRREHLRAARRIREGGKVDG